MKRWLYRILFGYQIHPSAYIGFAFIDVDQLIMDKSARIAHFNRIQGLHRLELGERSEIKHSNTIVISRHLNRKSVMSIGSRSIVTRNHFFDLTGNISIGSDTVIGGIGSQFWTHSFDTKRTMHIGHIEIGNNCFIGSSVRFSPGSGISDHCIVGIGSVLTRFYTDTHVLIAGIPARIVRKLTNVREH
jgi:acetyltransferase-like isoleucine patch superfamily enzyme